MIKFFKNLFAPSDSGLLKEAIKNGAFLVDVRTPSEFSSGSVQDAVNIPLNKLSTQLSRCKGKKNIVVFCRSGSRSGQAQRILESNGFENVINGGSWLHVNQILNQVINE